jgi:peptide/nickel transport system substrate-binding protein
VPLAACVLLAAAGCGGGSANSGGGSSGGKTVLRVGTTSYIDSLNPFVAINSQSYNAFVMEYPQLVQYGPGNKLIGDWATSWSSTPDGKTWTFHLKPGGKWSDGKPLTAEDAAWTGNTIIKYQTGATAVLSAALTHVASMQAQGPDTLVIHYEKPVANVLPQLEQFWVLPEHVWGKVLQQSGPKGLKSYLPENHLPTVAAGAYSITQFQEKGTTIFKPNPYFYGPKSQSDAVTMTYYTNATSMIAALQGGNLDFVDQVPYEAIASLKSNSNFKLQSELSSTVTNITINSNPAKPTNRELLSPKVREALEYATDRNQIVRVVYAGYAKPWANMLSAQSGPWLDPSIKPLPYDPAKANQLLDSLGYKRGSNGVREVPATTGKYAQHAHPMAYGVIVPDSLDFNGDRQFQIIASDWAKVGVKLTEINGGDASQAYALETAGNYTKYDLATWDWAEYIDPDAQLSYMTKAQWNSWSDTGYNNPAYDAMYQKQATILDFNNRKALVEKMTRIIAADRPYIQLVDEGLVIAHANNWTGFYPNLNAYCKCYYTTPHQT